MIDVINQTRLKVWQQQDADFFEEAVIEAAGTMVETTGECKFGMDINYQGQWGYHPLIVSLANTAEPLFIINRSGNRPSHEEAPEYLDRAVELCRRADFRRITLRRDTDFSLTAHFDRWEEKHTRKKQQLLRMEFSTVCQALINIPAQIIRMSRRIIYRLLSWNRWQAPFFRLLDVLQTPLRC